MLPTIFMSLLALPLMSFAAPRGTHQKEARQSVQPQCWNGTNFPDPSSWTAFDQSFQIQHNSMLFSGDSNDEISDIKASIQHWSSVSGVDSRLILAIIMRESSGRVDTVCGDNGKSCGIMQVQGPGSYITCSAHPCSSTVIDNMVQCGTNGQCPNQTGSDLKSCLARYGNSPAAAARCYNTGSVTNLKDYTVAKYGIRSYVSDIANILLGAESPTWTKLESQCFPDNSPCGDNC